MPRRVPLPAPLHGRAFSVSDPAALHLTAGRLRGSDLDAPFRGVRMPAEAPSTISSVAHAYSTRMPRHAFVSHVSAALLHGIPLPPGLGQMVPMGRRAPLDVSVPAGTVAATGNGLRGHRIRIDPADIVELRGLRVTSAARTWCDLAPYLSHEDLVAAGDYLLWRRHPRHLRLSQTDLVHALERFEGRRGKPALVHAHPRLSDRSDSRPESVIRVRCGDAGLPEPEINVDLFAPHGAFLARPDLSWRRYWTTFDYEGDGHRTDSDQWERDIGRVPRLENAHYAHVRGSKADLRNSNELIGNLALRMRHRGWIPAPSSLAARALKDLPR